MRLEIDQGDLMLAFGTRGVARCQKPAEIAIPPARLTQQADVTDAFDLDTGAAQSP